MSYEYTFTKAQIMDCIQRQPLDGLATIGYPLMERESELGLRRSMPLSYANYEERDAYFNEEFYTDDGDVVCHPIRMEQGNANQRPHYVIDTPYHAAFLYSPFELMAYHDIEMDTNRTYRHFVQQRIEATGVSADSYCLAVDVAERTSNVYYPESMRPTTPEARASLIQDGYDVMWSNGVSFMVQSDGSEIPYRQLATVDGYYACMPESKYAAYMQDVPTDVVFVQPGDDMVYSVGGPLSRSELMSTVLHSRFDTAVSLMNDRTLGEPTFSQGLHPIADLRVSAEQGVHDPFVRRVLALQQKGLRDTHLPRTPDGEHISSNEITVQDVVMQHARPFIAKDGSCKVLADVYRRDTGERTHCVPVHTNSGTMKQASIPFTLTEYQLFRMANELPLLSHDAYDAALPVYEDGACVKKGTVLDAQHDTLAASVLAFNPYEMELASAICVKNGPIPSPVLATSLGETQASYKKQPKPQHSFDDLQL